MNSQTVSLETATLNAVLLFWLLIHITVSGRVRDDFTKFEIMD